MNAPTAAVAVDEPAAVTIPVQSGLHPWDTRLESGDRDVTQCAGGSG